MVYLFVLLMSLLVVAIGVSAVELGRVRLRESKALGDAAAARNLARSAIEVGLVQMSLHSDWRTKLGVGTWLPNTRVGSAGMMRLEATALDTSTPTDDAVTLVGTGAYGEAVQMLQVVVRRGAVIERSTWTRKMN
jgi:hypothetical protein